eukprot:SAG31_NODE_1117_length_9817_cov_6.416650_3_plen_180_part_00
MFIKSGAPRSNAKRQVALQEDARRVFERFDARGNGFLRFDELQPLLSAVFPDGDWRHTPWRSVLLKKLGADEGAEGLTAEQYVRVHTALMTSSRTAAWGRRSCSKLVRAAALYARMSGAERTTAVAGGGEVPEEERGAVRAALGNSDSGASSAPEEEADAKLLLREEGKGLLSRFCANY